MTKKPRRQKKKPQLRKKSPEKEPPLRLPEAEAIARDPRFPASLRQTVELARRQEKSGGASGENGLPPRWLGLFVNDDNEMLARLFGTRGTRILALRQEMARR